MPPPNTPMAALPPHELDSQSNEGGTSLGPAVGFQGKKYGNDCLVIVSILYLESSRLGT